MEREFLCWIDIRLMHNKPFVWSGKVLTGPDRYRTTARDGRASLYVDTTNTS